MRRQRRSDVEAPGQDSFLDIVANLVGILIILIMLVGAHVKEVLIQVDTASIESPATQQSEIDIDTPRNTAAAVENDIHRVDRKIQVQKVAIILRRTERDSIHTLVTSLEKHLEGKREKLDRSQREQFDFQRRLTEMQNRLEDLKHNREVVDRSTATTKVIRHLPTPMAKTVFGKEIHFRLHRGRIVYVPWDELLQRLQAEAPQKQWKLKQATRITETIGPLGGFWLKYSLRRGQFLVQSEAGPVRRSGIQFEGFVLNPVSDELGEPIEQAMQPGSDFIKRISGLNPDQNTITVWVYPDSFEQFRALKEMLFQRGFSTASRPMPEGHPIGGSPNGSRSAAQ